MGSLKDEEWLTTAQVAKWLNVSTRHVENMRQRNGGPTYVKLGGRLVRYRRSDVEEWAAMGRRDSTRG